jgi:hypothetical protein
MLSKREAFKVGFLLRCADEGLNEEQVNQRIEKLAFSILSPTTAGILLAAGIGLPLALGAGAGHVAAKAQEQPIDVDTVKKQELIAEYKRLTDLARQQKKLKMIRSR